MRRRPRRCWSAADFDPETGRFRAGSTIAAGTSVDVARLWYPTLDGDALAAIVVRVEETFRVGGIAHSVALPGVAETLANSVGVATSWGLPPTTAPGRRPRR